MAENERRHTFDGRHFFAAGLVVFLLTIMISMTAPLDRAEAACSVPNQISNGQVADATAIMGNFNALANCANSTVTTSGSPAAGSLSVFSGLSSITAGDLSGDCVTTGALTVTCTKSNGVPFGYFATGTDAGQLTGTVSTSRFGSGVNADSSHFLRGDGVWAVPSGTGGGGGAGNFVKLATTALAANGTTISFSGIDQSYTDLVLIIYPKMAGNAANNTVSVTLNGDSGNNYDWALQSRFEGSNTYNVSAAQIAWIGYQNVGNAPIEIELFDYTDTTMTEKHMRATSTGQGGGNYFRRNFDAKWHPATMAAVVSITIVCATNFLAGTHAVLYGRG